VHSITINDATRSDLTAVGIIMNHAIEKTTAVWYDRTKSEEDISHWWQAKQDGNWPVIVARSAGQVVGYGTFGPFRPFDGYRFTVEHSLYVDPSAQGKGIGKAILQSLIDIARTRRLHVMVGGIDAENQISLALHRSLGFLEVARMPEVGTKFNSWRTLVFMQRTLTVP
jgi:phosphinothricin acetyltransferase